MRLIVTEKNDAAQQIASLLGDKKPVADKVYKTPVYRFTNKGQECVAIGLRGHILGVDFPEKLQYKKRGGWTAVDGEGNKIPATVPASLAKPPFKKGRAFEEDAVLFNAWSIPTLPYMVYSPLVKTPAEREIIRALKNLAAKADDVVIGTDFDREGELIGSDAVSMIRQVAPDVPITRARYSAFTKEEITHAFDNLVEVDQALADAGESRRFIDLIWGAILTRYLTLAKRTTVSTSRSAGRVQTPTLALVVDRERERLAYIPKDYWTITGSFAKEGAGFEALYVSESVAPRGEKKDENKIWDKAEADAVMEVLQDQTQGTVTGLTKKSLVRRPPAPFNTTSLMGAASSIGIAPSRTMRIAESLYMKGLTSYPRVDNEVYPASLNLADVLKMLTGVPQYAPFARELLAKKKLTPTRGKKETTDHPPIYPTGVASESSLRPEEWKVYNLIARRFMATLSDSAIVESTKIDLDVCGQPFSVSGSVLAKPGYRAVYPFSGSKDVILPAVEEGEVVDFNGATCEGKQTEPKPRYSQQKLIEAMEANGLGTKSTRADIIETLYDRHYIVNTPVEPTKLGIAICEALEQYAPTIVSPDMTAELESEMDAIVAGNSDLETVVNHSRDLLAEIVDELIPCKAEVGSVIADAVNADAKVGTCPKCGGDLLVRSSPKTRGRFVGCSSWPECDVTYPLPSQGKLETLEEPCPECGAPQVKITPFRSKPQVRCLDPNCSTNFEPTLDVGACPTCAAKGVEGRLIAQKSPRTLKRFIRCTNYDECGTSYPLPQSGALSYEGEVCEACGSPIVVIASRRGPWHTCVNMGCPSREKTEKKSGGRGKKAGAKKTTRKSSRSSK